MRILEGTSNIFYLFEREKFNWTVKDANLYDSATMTISIFGTLSGLFVLKHLLKVPDIIIIVVSLGSKIAATVVITLATLWWHLYFASMIGFIGSLYGSMCRSMISQSVERHEIGKIFAVTTALEAVSTLIAAPFYTFIYTKTYKNFASAFNLITIAILTINVILSL
jgi:PCFT/HCP family folate transporter-like MFS transporter 1/3